MSKEGEFMNHLFQGLLAVDHTDVFNFFASGLKDEIGERNIRRDEFFYVVSVLANFAQVPRYCEEGMPISCNFSEIFDRFIIPTDLLIDAEILEDAGAQTLFLAGFFRDQMKHRHNVLWYDEIGQSFYDKACQYEKDYQRRILFNHMAESFKVWAIICRNLSRSLRDRRYILKYQ